jgi:hypothetical protein
MKTRTLAGLVAGAITSWNLGAAPLTAVHSFSTETKLKGGFTPSGDRLYAAAEKGGDHGFGYIASFDPADGTLTPVYHFPADSKVKGGFIDVGGSLYFMTEKGGPTHGFGYIGRFIPSTAEVALAHEFESDVKAKSGFVEVGGALWFATEKGGAGNGFIGRFDREARTVTAVAPLNQVLGIKVESLAISADGLTVYAGAREGGEVAELSGKGAGSLLAVDVASGEVRQLLAFQAARHGAKLRGLTVSGDALWFIQEEGGNLGVNQGKGGGVVARYDPGTGTFTTVHVFDGGPTGFKPKGFAGAGGDFYFVTESGGTGGLGVFGVLRGGTEAEVIGELDATTSAKPDHVMSVVGGRIYFATELGGANYLGGIVAYAIPSGGAQPSLAIERIAGGRVRVQVRAEAGENPPVLESAAGPEGPWQVLQTPLVAAPDGWTVELEASEATRVLRAAAGR